MIPLDCALVAGVGLRGPRGAVVLPLVSDDAGQAIVRSVRRWAASTGRPLGSALQVARALPAWAEEAPDIPPGVVVAPEVVRSAWADIMAWTRIPPASPRAEAVQVVIGQPLAEPGIVPRFRPADVDLHLEDGRVVSYRVMGRAGQWSVGAVPPMPSSGWTNNRRIRLSHCNRWQTVVWQVLCQSREAWMLLPRGPALDWEGLQ